MLAARNTSATERIFLIWYGGVSSRSLPLEALLFDHLVSAREQDRRDIETQGSCRLQVDYELELGPLLHRQVGWFCPFEDFVDEAGRAVPHVFDASRIGE